MKGINHLVLAARDLGAIRTLYENLGFTLTAAGQHPFGTGNTIIQLHGTYLELLAVTRPQDVVEHGSEEFSFSAFNRDYLRRHEGFSMMVLDSHDADRDLADWKAQGLRTHAPFRFARQATTAEGEEVTVGFSLALVSNPAAPWLGLFACQHFRPDYYAQPRFMSHRNRAHRVRDVWISGPRTLELASYLATVASSQPRRDGPDAIVIATATGDIVLATPERFERSFGMPPPHMADGPHLAGFTMTCASTADLPAKMMTRAGERLVVPPSLGFGTAIAFTDTA